MSDLTNTSGLTAKQLRVILGQIAVSADTLKNFAMDAGGRSGPAAAYDFHMVQYAAERIGALASLGADDGRTLSDWSMPQLDDHDDA